MNSAIILAAGKGTRMKAGINKQYLNLRGKPILLHTLEVFFACDIIDEIILVIDLKEKELCYNKILSVLGKGKPIKVVSGGKERQESVRNGLLAADCKGETVVVHDGARPFINCDMIKKCVLGAEKWGAVTLGVPAKETLKVVDDSRYIQKTLDRECTWITQTPQAFKRELLIKAHEEALSDNGNATDDAMLVERLGHQVKMLPGDYSNIKITTKEDLKMADSILAKEVKELDNLGERSIRIGNGFDVHPLVCGRKLILGGVEIPFEKGLQGHSDADVLIHAILDSLLGAWGKGDIGIWFPPDDSTYKDISSITLLNRISIELKKEGYIIGNIDSVIVAERPKLASYISEMKNNIVACLGIKENQINIKATTTEGLGYTGRGEGISSHAVSCIYK